MQLAEARERVIESGKKLLQAGLMARTWGNVSCRLSDSHFVITPSGRAYEDLRPDEIVIANLHNEDTWGDVLPSTETGIHREVYHRRPEVKFTIHTHQFEASVYSALDLELEAADVPVFDERVPCARYGLPGSATLCQRVSDAMDATSGKAVLMAHHGPLLMGESDEEGFRLALALEIVAARRIAGEYLRVTGREVQSRESIYDHFLDHFGQHTMAYQFFHSERTEHGFVLHGPGGPDPFEFDDPDMPAVARVIRSILLARPDVNHVVQGIGGACLTFSALGGTLPVYLDDFAQICGIRVACAGEEPDAVAAALGDEHLVFVPDSGALCCGGTLEDATACAIIAEKNARAHFVSQLFNVSHPLREEDVVFMRDFYLSKYSKRY